MKILIAFTTLLLAWAPVGGNIKTRWAAEVSPENARTEYPRPQMCRPDWKCLNGLWDYAITGKDIAQMPQTEGHILVPFCVESSLSGVCRRVDENQTLWYKRVVERPSGWEGKKILLHFDAVDWSAEVFVNGALSCKHTGGFTAFELDITEALENGSAEIVVKVWDPSDDPTYSVPRGKQYKNPNGIWYTPVTGIWQSVWMEAVPVAAHIRDYNVVTSIDGTINVKVDVEGEADDVKVEILRPRVGYNPEKPARGLFKKAKSHGSDVSLKVRRPKLWSNENPWLYGVRIKLFKDGKMIDKVDGYTAIREISQKCDENGVKRLALNDEILFQFGPLDQGWWPDGLYTAPTAEAMAWDIEQTKELGFNMIRKHIKIEPSRWYYDCDRLGMMVWQDMPCIGDYKDRSDWGQGADCYGAGRDYWALSKECRDNYYKEWTEIVAQLKKFQSIVVWVPFNEAWGQFDTKDVCDYTRLLDPTRLINAASGGNWIKDAGDILDTHTYPNPKMRILDSAMVNVLGEFGGIGRPIEGHLWEIGRKWGYVQYDSEKKVTDAYCLYVRDLIDVKQLDMCAAAVYTQTTDVEGEVNGFYTYDRDVLKVDAARVRKANMSVINAPCVPELPLACPSSFHYKINGSKSHLKLFALRNGDLTMQVTDHGARIVSLFAPDHDIVTADGHGVDDYVIWKMKERTDSSIVFAFAGADGLNLELEYSISGDNCLGITYKATTGKRTMVEQLVQAAYDPASGRATGLPAECKFVSEGSFHEAALRQGETFVQHSTYRFGE